MKQFSPSPARRFTAWFLITLIVLQVALPTKSYALTGGPSQPEVQSFEPIGTSEMVDVSSGSFNYNIPLLDVGGYPINLAYHSGVNMDDEASCMGGLGWNINVGVINRNMRGLPDDFSGDWVKKEFNMKPNTTWGGKVGVAFEMFGIKGTGGAFKGNLSMSVGGYYNNYRGVGLEFGIAPSFSASAKGGPQGTLGLGLTANSGSGIAFSPQLGLNFQNKVRGANMGDQGYLNCGGSIGTSVSSRQGVQSLTIGTSLGISSNNKFVNSKGEEDTKNDASRSLYGGDASFNFSSPTYAPGGQFSYLNQSLSLAFTIGGELWGINPSASFTGYYSKQELMDRAVTSPAFGTMYAHNGANRYGALMDFNREKDMSFTEHTPNLPLPVPTQDIYSAAGQGIAGSYQLKRGDVGVFSDPLLQSFGGGPSIGGEVGLGNAYHAGIDIVANFNSATSKSWDSDNSIAGPLAFQSGQINSDFEPAYFKIAGEKSVESDPVFIQTIGGTRPVRADLDGGKTWQMKVKAKSNFEGRGPLPSAVKRRQRDKRNQPVTYLTAAEAGAFALDKAIVSYAPNVYGAYTSPTVNAVVIPRRDASIRKPHHISEVTVLRQDGLRYIYGIPAYNTKQEDVGFSVNGTGDCQTGLVNYVPNVENTKDNTSGMENYFSKTSLPPYAHAYLLTAVLSPDYVDLTGNGPTDDDLGTYTKFRYTRVFDNYRWRIPYQRDAANFNEGFKTMTDDNKANYLYGEKEYWLMHSAESKTQLAEFYYSNREDGWGVEEENGGIDPDPTRALKKLDKIVLFSLPDRLANQANAEPVKTVHFDYDYSLLRGVPNNMNGGGKLTLKRLFFTYGRSNKGKLSPYVFHYEDHPANQQPYVYNQKAYNRWGTFNPNTTANACGPSDPLTTDEFPYVPQNNRPKQDEYASWMNLKQIDLPSGGVIKVEYEANDYAFVQHHRAMEMVQIDSFAKDLNSSSVPRNPAQLYDNSSPNTYAFFKLPKKIPANTSQTDADNEIWHRYVQDPGGFGLDQTGYVYFKCLVEVGTTGSQQYEYVPGYAQFEAAGAAQSVAGGAYDLGYIKLHSACVKDKGKFNTNKCGGAVHPISKAAWQFARLNLPRIAYGEPDPQGKVGKQMLEAMGALVQQFGQFIEGFNQKMLDKGFAKEVKLGKSWLRLFSPAQKKIGGGVRVKSIRISDEWSGMGGTSYTSAAYGQEYDYTKIENRDTLSSGVAAYEPLVGGDENPFRQPIPYDETLLLAPDNNHYQEGPFGESFFPSPQIVYSRVTVRNLANPGVKRHATGHIVHEYYTARDFPTKYTDTGVRPVRKRTSPIFKLLKIKMKDYMTAAQGYVVENNDMHGKPKAQWVYDESGTQISGVEYRYKTDAQGLNNTVMVVRPDGKLQKQNIGLEASLCADSRESLNKVTCPGVHINSDGFLVGVFPGLAVVPLPQWQEEETRFRSFVTTKVVHRYGLLQATVAHDLGSQVATENLAWDSETGEVLLTKTYNEHDDPVYNFNFPAHWAYQGMQAAYRNIGAEVQGSFNQGTFSTNAVHLFTPGDEVMVSGSTQKGWVKDVNPITSQIYVIGDNGKPFAASGSPTLKIIRSGHRNQQLSSVGSLTSLALPFDAGLTALDFKGKQILQASAIEYDDRWQTWCGEKTVTTECKCQPLSSSSQAIIAEFIALLNSQISSGVFVLKSKSSPFTLSGGQYPLLNAFMNGKCTPPPGWTGGNTPNWFATELSGNDLKCSFGKGYSDIKTCWEGCLIIKNFKIMLDAPLPTVLNFNSPQPNLTACDGKSLCFKADVLASRDQQGNNFPQKQPMTFTFCADGADCFGFFECQKLQKTVRCGDQAPGDTVNPYRLNIRGVYRPKRTWAYLTDRVPEPTASASVDAFTRTDGQFNKFSSFWKPTPGGNLWYRDATDWTWAKQVTRFNPVGNEVENVDALGNFSAELVGYANTQVTAVANNARYRQIAFEGFEDYGFAMPGCQRHFGFTMPFDTTSATSHTGRYSIAVPPASTVSTKYSVVSPQCPPLIPNDQPMLPYPLHECDCVGKFAPDPGKRYVFSAWVKENQPLGTLNYGTASIVIKTGGQTFTFKAAGQIIEGWQRIYGEFDLPATATDIEVLLQGNGVAAWFDDLRFVPFDGSLKTFVYHPRTLRFTHELDENNYFTEYEYDAGGMLERVKKETERGVMTIQESRFGQKKQ